MASSKKPGEERTYSREAVPGKPVLLKGWVERVRDLGGMKFFILRDREGTIQVTVKKDSARKELLDTVNSLLREYCVEVRGEVRKSQHTQDGREVIPEKIAIVSAAKAPLPIETNVKFIDTGLDKRFDFRFIDMRNPKVQSVFRIRDRVFAKMRDFFESDGFIEIHTPVIQKAGAEGGATLFPMTYYSQKAYLRQSPQLYKQIMMASGLDRVYEIGPAFRAEKFHTRRHVSEFLSVDFEMAWIDSEEDVMKIMENFINYVIKETKKDSKAELDILERKVKVPEPPFKRMTYDDALKILEKNNILIPWGSDLEDAQEKLLGEIMAKSGHEWYFITGFPSKIKPFYIMQDGRVSRGLDIDCNGMEIASGGQREHRHDALEKVMKQKGLNLRDFSFYLDAFSYGMPPHGGMGIGGDRIVQQIVGIDNIKETILFPRTPERISP